MATRCSILAATVALVAALVAATACSSSRSPSPGSSSEETFATTIEPLVQEKCQSCHREGGIAPFPLVTYEQLKEVAPFAKDLVARREMPPWGAVDDPSCDVRHGFKGDLSLSQEQIDTFVRWVDRGMPRGDPAKINPPRTKFEPLGLVDKTDAFDVAPDHVVAGGAEDDIRCFPVDPGLTDADTWVVESIVVPADPKVVHHALVYLDPGHEGIQKAGGEPSYSCFGGPELTDPRLLLAWSPGGTSTSYGDDTALRIPKGAHLVVQVHYHPLAASTTGRLSVEVKTIPQAPVHIAEFVLIGNAENAQDRRSRLLPGPDDPQSGPEFLIPSNAKNHVEAMEVVIPVGLQRARLSAVGAHMHWAGVGMKVEVDRRAPEGDPAHECLLNAVYDFAWQRTYAYDAAFDQTPIVRAGDKIRITCIYDNTKDNPYIVRAMNEQRRTTPAPIRLGGTSADEMCQAILVLVE